MSSDTDFELDEMQEIIDDFLVEADELIESLDTNLVKLESAPEDLDLLNEIFRAAHTVKGTSSFLGFEQVTELTHKMEDVLNKLRKSELEVTPEIMDLLLESLDLLKVLLDNVRNRSDETLDLEDIIKRLIAVQDGDPSPADGTEPESPDEGGSVEPVGDEQPRADDSPVTDDLGSPADDPATPTADISTTPETTPRKDSPRKPGGEKKHVEQTIRVDVSRLDSLMNIMGELVLSRNSLLQTVNNMSKVEDINEVREQLNRASTSVNYITTELQLSVMKMRMQPIGKVFSKFPRLVRDLARETQKEIELKITGEATELDRSVIEEIGDPLVHLIRNSCDHGIEPPDERVQAGKSSKGTVWLTAAQEGSNIIIKIEDDGRGLNVDGIKAKALERGLASEAELERLPNKEIFRFIFEAGFSTAKVVSDISGRGVGMDVVRSNIEKLNGIIELDSKLGQGTTITIKLPLTLAIIQGLLVESDDEVFILPLASVHETVRSDASNVYYVNQRPVLRLRDEIIPVVNIGELLRNSSQSFILTEKPYIVIVGLADRKLGIIIDRFLGQEEVVIKSLGSYLGSTEGVAGATILGDGRIRLIVDLLGLFNIAKKL
ncbi:hybrid sensor histidine kinase/response regulator [candidate division GN15 bacterium]|nr:hybrid sensor histidine kinase/response regulator [candidate division GN15 bacterium]